LEIYGGYPSGGGIPNSSVYETILDAKGVGGIGNDSAHHIVFLDSTAYWAASNDTTVIAGFTFRNAHAKLLPTSYFVNGNVVYSDFGASMYCQNGQYKIYDCIFENNIADGVAAGIYFQQASGSISNCVFKNNIGNNGVAASFSSGNNYCTFSNNIITQNKGDAFALTTGYGYAHVFNNHIHHNDLAGFSGVHTQLELHDNIITHNEPIVSIVGAISMFYGNSNIYGNEIKHNNGMTAGAIELENGNHNVHHNIIQYNTSYGTAGVHSKNATFTLNNNNISYNYCQAQGGAISCTGGSANNIFDNIITYNSAEAGGGIAIGSFGNTTIINNIISNNTATHVAGGILATKGAGYIMGNVISNNFSDSIGGVSISIPILFFVNNTVYNNKSNANNWLNKTGGLMLGTYNYAKVQNNIFWGNQLGTSSNVINADYHYHFGQNILFQNNVLQLPGNSYDSILFNSNYIGTGSSNNIFGISPQFIDTTNIAGIDNIFKTNDDGLQLKNLSAALDSGDSLFVTIPFVQDVSMSSRIYGQQIDRGAYERNCSPINITNIQQSKICAGQSTTLTVVSNQAPASILWYNDSSSNSIINTGDTFNAPILNNTDTFWVMSNNCSAIKYPIVVTVDTITPLLNVSTNTYTICIGQSVTLTALSNTIADSVKWYSNALSNSAIFNGLQYTTSALFATDTFWVSAHACTSTNKIPIAITINPIYNDTQYVNACKNYVWSATNQSYSNSGLYTAIFSDIYGCDSIENIQLDIQNFNPTITANNNILTTTTIASNYQWVLCNPYQLINNATANTYTATSNGDYAVICTINNCQDTSSCITINNLHDNYLVNKNNILIYPNPANNFLQIDFDKLSPNTIIEILDGYGKIIHRNNINNKNTKLAVENYAKGFYIVKIINNNSTNIYKIMIQ
jgi:hypothetical protein